MDGLLPWIAPADGDPRRNAALPRIPPFNATAGALVCPGRSRLAPLGLVPRQEHEGDREHEERGAASDSVRRAQRRDAERTRGEFRRIRRRRDVSEPPCLLPATRGRRRRGHVPLFSGPHRSGVGSNPSGPTSTPAYIGFRSSLPMTYALFCSDYVRLALVPRPRPSLAGRAPALVAACTRHASPSLSPPSGQGTASL
jgi:hypothetical protein